MNMTRLLAIFWLFALLSGGFLFLAACSGDEDTVAEYPIDPDDRRRLKHGKITGDDGIQLFGLGSDRGGGGSGIGVNSFLWQATLDTLSFMPLSSVDPHGGVIITDWYEDPDARGERFKLNVVILGTELRSDGVRVSVFKQKKQNAEWRDAKVSGDTARELEDKILTRARELRIQSR